ncbi:methyltransferase domain-containing protein [Rickettsia endosymbiont of Halotydeus destructor]
MERLKIIDKSFENILDIGCRAGYLTKLLKTDYPDAKIVAADMSDSLLNSFKHDHKLLIDEEQLELAEASFDLITYSLGLHWINDIQKFLFNIKKFLKPDGIFIGNFVGGGSLKNLRNCLIEAEISVGHTHSPHISPFIHFDHMLPLLTGAGFLEIIIDYENIKLEFDTSLDLMREIQNIGESNALIQRSHYGVSKQMLSLLEKSNGNIFEDQITLISFIASPIKNSIRLK